MEHVLTATDAVEALAFYTVAVTLTIWAARSVLRWKRRREQAATRARNDVLDRQHKTKVSNDDRH